MKENTLMSLAYLLLISAVLTGCFKMMDNPSGSNEMSFISTYPANNSINVETNQPIIVEFASSVIPKIIEENCKLIKVDENSYKKECMCGGFDPSKIQNMQGDSSMMNYLKNQNQIKGSFKWNSNKTKCEFVCDDNLDINSDYILIFDNQMMNHMRSLMNTRNMMSKGMGMMNCKCQNKCMDNQNILVHFRTKK